MTATTRISPQSQSRQNQGGICGATEAVAATFAGTSLFSLFFFFNRFAMRLWTVRMNGCHVQGNRFCFGFPFTPSWERTCGGNFMADPMAGKWQKSARNEISREQETLPSETWERGNTQQGPQKHALTLFESEAQVADGEFVADVDVAVFQCDAVDGGAVGGFEVFDVEAALGDLEEAMLAGNGGVGDGDVAGGVASDEAADFHDFEPLVRFFHADEGQFIFSEEGFVEGGAGLAGWVDVLGGGNIGRGEGDGLGGARRGGRLGQGLDWNPPGG